MISALFAGPGAPARSILNQSSRTTALLRSHLSSSSNIRCYAKKVQKRATEKPTKHSKQSPQSPSPKNPVVKAPKATPFPASIPKPLANPANRYAYPSRLLIYNSGTGKTAYIGVQKIAPIVLFVYACGELVPAQWHEPSYFFAGFDWSPLVTSSVAALSMFTLGLAPLLVLTLLTSPFVNSIFLHVPAAHCLTRQTLFNYIAALPPSARLDITTMRLLPFQKTTSVRLDELRRIRKGRWWGLANLKRVEREGAAAEMERHVETMRREGAKGWFAWLGRLVEPRRKFYVDIGKGEERSRAPGVWPEIMKKIEQQK